MIKFLFQKFQELSDWAAIAFGSPWFFVFHTTWWSVWIFFTVEPFPYGLLTLIVSLESILLSGLILNATNRSGDFDRKIINTDLKLDKHTNKAVHEMHEMLNKIMKKLDLHTGDLDDNNLS